MPTTYYKLEGRGLTIAEYRRLFPNFFQFLVMVAKKPFGSNQFPFSIGRSDTLLEVEWQDLPSVAVQHFKPHIRSFERAGFEYLFCYRFPVLEPYRFGVAAILLSPDKRTIGTVYYGGEPLGGYCYFGCVSKYADGTWGITTTARQRLESRPETHIERHPDATAAQLYDRHRLHLVELTAHDPVCLDSDSVRRAVLEVEMGNFDFHIARGAFVPMTEEDMEAARRNPV